MTDETQILDAPAVPGTALTVAERAAIALRTAETEKTLTELAARTASIVAITNADGYTQVHSGRMALKNQRVEIQKRGKAAREDATAFSTAVIAEEKRLIAIISPEEERLQKLQKTHDDAKEAERLALVAAENNRVAAIKARVNAIRDWPTLSAGKPAAVVTQILNNAEGFTVGEDFQEFEEEARAAAEASRTALREIHAERVAFEAEQARVAAEREELARLRAEQEERDRLAQVERDAEAARLQARLQAEREEQERQAAAERERIAKEEREAAELRAALAAQQQKDLRLQREEQARLDEEARLRRETEEAEHQERLRQQQIEADRIAQEQKAALDAEIAAENERLRLQREENERVERERQEAQQRNEAAMQEVQAIHHQLLIADIGRAPYIKGRTREGIQTLIDETEAWPITEDKFGVLTSAATAARDSTLKGLREKLAAAQEREAREAEEARKAEQARLAAIKRPSDEEIISVLAAHYQVPGATVMEWLARPTKQRRTRAVPA